MININNEQKSKIYAIASPFWAVKRSVAFNEFDIMFKLYQTLPENIKIVATDQESANAIWQISQRYNLSEQQISALAVAAWDLLSAQIPISGYISALSQRLNIDENTARSIAQEQNVKIFSKAALQIKKLNENNFPEFGAKPQPPAQLPIKSVIQSEYHPIIRKPEERVVNLKQESKGGKEPEKSRFIDPGPKVEGNVVDLSLH